LPIRLALNPLPVNANNDLQRVFQNTLLFAFFLSRRSYTKADEFVAVSFGHGFRRLKLGRLAVKLVPISED
jgi:hypothetical protein